MSTSGRKRTAAALSTALPIASSACAASAGKAAPPKPAGAKYVACHSSEKDAAGRLLRFPDAPAWFRPSLTPREMLLQGMHGGIYFNPKGGKPGVKYPRAKYPNGIPGVTTDEFPKEWFEGVPRELYASRRYSTAHNCYKVKSGLDQAGWESSGWINECDPRGWTQWYFRFFMGRRLSGGEDERQMARWSGVCGDKGRWKQNLIAKCLRDGKAHDDESVSPVVRQTLLHWAYELTHGDFVAGSKRVKTHGAAYVSTDSLRGVLSGKKGSTAGSGGEEEANDGAAAKVKAEEGQKARSERAIRRASGASVDAATERPAKRARGSPRAGGRGAAAAPPASAPLSAYEQERDAQKVRNQAKLAELGLA